MRLQLRSSMKIRWLTQVTKRLSSPAAAACRWKRACAALGPSSAAASSVASAHFLAALLASAVASSSVSADSIRVARVSGCRRAAHFVSPRCVSFASRCAVRRGDSRVHCACLCALRRSLSCAAQRIPLRSAGALLCTALCSAPLPHPRRCTVRRGGRGPRTAALGPRER